MYYVYILKSQTIGRYYIGSTNNIKDRLARHNSGRNKSTKYGIPWNLLRIEEFKTKQEAYKREFQIKKYKGGEAFKKLVN